MGASSSAQLAIVPAAGGAVYDAGAAAVRAAPLAAPTLGLAPALAAPTLAASLPATSAAPVPARGFEKPSGRAHTLTGDVRFKRDFRSAALGNSRTIAVYLPPGYDSSNERYPVLYMQDGQNLFDAATAFGGNEWGIDETCEKLMRSGELPPFIVVAVYNTGDRISEYSPAPDAEYGGGRGDLYGEFLINELKPYVDANLRTLPDAEHTGLMGSSLGGLISLHLGLGHPDVFSRIAALSTPLWWADGELARRLASSPSAEIRPRVWLDAGTREKNASDRIAEMRGLGEALKARGWREGDDLAVRVIDGAGHNERSWGERGADVLKFLFPVRTQP